MQSLLEFIQKYYDKANVGDTPENTGQCTGISELWIDNFSLPHIYGNAKDLLQNADKASFTVTQNSPDNYPKAGDIAVWGETWGNGFGHTGVVVSADATIFSTFEQNNPSGHKPDILTHDYSGVIGWLTPNTPTTPQNELQAQLDQCRVDRDSHWNDLQTAKTTLDNLNQQINDRNNDITQLNATTMTLKTQLQACQDQVTTLTPIAATVPNLKEELAQATNDRQVCLSAQENQNKIIANLKASIAAGKPKTFIDKLKYLFT